MKKRKCSPNRAGANAERTVCNMLNIWAGDKNDPVFKRVGYGYKGQDLVCRWPNWGYNIEIKLQEISFTRLPSIISKEIDDKGYCQDTLWFFYRNSGRIWLAISQDIVSEIEQNYGESLLDNPYIIVINHKVIGVKFYTFEAKKFLTKLIDPGKIWGES